MRECKPVDDDFDTSFLDEVAEPEPIKPTPTGGTYTGSGGTFDLRGFIARNGIKVNREMAVDGGTKWQIQCPFDSSHTGTDAYLQQYASGAMVFKCSHTSCSSYRWQDLRQKLEPREQRQSNYRHEHQQQQASPLEPFDLIDIGDFIESHPTLDEVLVDGMLRRGETGNFISAPKVGKSWSMYDLAFAVATGGLFLGKYRCRQGRVLFLDAELRPATLAGRLSTVARHLNISASDYRGRIKVESLRGKLQNFYTVAAKLEQLQPGDLDLVICDAFYRFLPAGVSENENSEITSIYNLIDATSMRLNCAWLNVHHSSKGSQADKSVTDVGSGAGSQSRAADLHAIFRQHEQPGVYVLEAAVRSFAPLEPTAFRWEFPCWQPESEIDPEALKGKMTRQEQRQQERDAAAVQSVLDALQVEPLTARQLRGKTGLSRERLQRLLDIMEAGNQITGEPVIIHGNDCRQYRLPEDVGDDNRPPNHPLAHGAGRGVCGLLKNSPPTHPRTRLDAAHVEDRTNRPRGTAEDPIVFGEGT